MDNLIVAETAPVAIVTAPDSAPVETATVPMVGNYIVAKNAKNLFTLRGPDSKIISERFEDESDAKWYATRLTRLAVLWAAAALPGGKKVFMPKVPGNVGALTVAPVAKGYAVLGSDSAQIGPVFTDKRNGKVDAFRFAERRQRGA